MYTVFIVCIIIVIVVLILSVVTTSKAYSFKHTVDTLENNPFIEQEDKQKNLDQDQKQA